MSAPDFPSPATLLRTAAYQGDLGTVRALIKEGVDLNVWDQWGRTALSLAAGEGHVEIVALLLKHGAWVNPHEDYDTYHTPLYDAATNGYLEVVKLLISAGADPNLHVWRSQRTPLAYIDESKVPELANFLRDAMEQAMKRQTREGG